MADDKYNSQKHRFQYIERIRKRRRRRVWLRILVGSIQQSVQNGHPRWLHSLITTRRCFLSRVPHRSPAARPQGLAKVVTTPGLIPVDILKSVSDGYSIIRLAASPPTSNYGKGRIFDPEPVSIFGLSSRMYAVGSRRRVGLLAHPDPRRSPDPSLFGMPIERAWINYLLLSFGKFRLRLHVPILEGPNPHAR